MVRLFVAVDLPAGVREGLSTLCFGVPGARWVEGDQLHLTLRFIGEVDGVCFRDIATALGAVGGTAFELTLDGLGHFPPRGAPRVLWAGVERSASLVSLRTRIESALASVGVAREGRKFAPHISLARLNGTPPSRVGRFFQDHPLFRSPPFTIDRFCLYSSTLGPRGARHRVEAEYPLVAHGGAIDLAGGGMHHP